MKYLVKKSIKFEGVDAAEGTIVDRAPSNAMVKLGLRFGQLEKLADQNQPETPKKPIAPPVDYEKLAREKRERQSRGGMATRFKPQAKKAAAPEPPAQEPEKPAQETPATPPQETPAAPAPETPVPAPETPASEPAVPTVATEVERTSPAMESAS